MTATKSITLMDRLRMRTTLLVPLLVLSLGWTLLSLLIIRTIVLRQIRANIASDLQHSLSTFQNLEQQRRELLMRESTLLADLPTLKALMTAHDTRTVEDAGADFWRISGSDFFALLATDGTVVAAFNNGPPANKESLQQQMLGCVSHPERSSIIFQGGHLYELAVQPLFFGDRAMGSPLGFVAVGYVINEAVARQVSDAAAADVAFAINGHIVASTLSTPMQSQLTGLGGNLLFTPARDINLRLGEEQYLAASASLTPAVQQGESPGAPQLIVLKSVDRSMLLLQSVNRWVAALGLLALLIGVTIIISISRAITRPLALLVEGTRALGQGDFSFELSEKGAEEVRELGRAFERMRVEVQRTQKELIASERQATIGRMASSISHDLRHYLSAMYANAEFLCDTKLSGPEREEIFEEVHSAVHGMTDLLDSLLLFTQTGRTLHPEHECIALLMQRAVSLVRSHPAARDVTIKLSGLSSLEAWVDSRQLGRALYNLLLNGCQAAKRQPGSATVLLTLSEDESFIRISVADSGPDVPETIRRTMFQPFVSQGKENGVGLGLTLAKQIVQEHGGYIHYGKTAQGYTLFTIVLPIGALRALAPPSLPIVAPETTALSS